MRSRINADKSLVGKPGTIAFIAAINLTDMYHCKFTSRRPWYVVSSVAIVSILFSALLFSIFISSVNDTAERQISATAAQTTPVRVSVAPAESRPKAALTKSVAIEPDYKETTKLVDAATVGNATENISASIGRPETAREGTAPESE
jgi:hypothetical protein